jgi:hypothetical protein
MTLKLATYEDVPAILEMTEQFTGLTAYGEFPQDKEKLTALVNGLLKDRNKGIIVLYLVDDKPVGMIAGMLTEMVFSREDAAQELVWWVNPEHRTRKSFSLKEAFEYWAKRVGAKYIIMAEPNNDKVARYYERTGYRPMERSHVKVIR